MSKSDEIIKIWASEIEQSPLKIDRKRQAIYLEKELVELAELEISLFEKLHYFYLENKKYYKILKLVLKVLIGVSAMSTKITNDKKTSYAGLIKMAISLIASVLAFFGVIELGNAVQTQIVAAILAIWGVVEAVQGNATNKADKE